MSAVASETAVRAAAAAEVVPLGNDRLALTLVFVALSMLVTRWLQVGLEMDIAWAAVRTAVQLLTVGFVLRLIFEADAFLPVLAATSVMLFTATWTASRRTAQPLPGLLPAAMIALSVGAVSTIVTVTYAIIHVQPFWAPRYFIPLTGMILGNAMNTTALLAERLQAEVAAREKEIEELLCLGASPRQAVAPALRASVRSALIPVVNNMLTVGLVSLPGMMTGQILGNGSTDTAARYQIMVMYMITSGSTLSCCILAVLIYGKFFDNRAWQLLRERYAPVKM